MRTDLKLPGGLTSVRAELEAALTKQVPLEWTEGDAFIFADQAETIGRILIAELHAHLLNAKVAYLFREKMQSGERVKFGVASRAPSKLLFLTDFDFTMELNWTAWRALTPLQRIALVDHELCHFAYDAEHERYTSREHDVEEFGEIVRRWGLWQPDLANFAKDVQKALAQLDLFQPPAIAANGGKPQAAVKKRARARAGSAES